MTREELFREFQSRIHEKRDSLNKSDCPEGYAFEEYQEGWRSAFSWATDILGKLISEQPSLPSNLDEAAEEYAYTNWEDNDYHEGASEGLPFDAIGHTEKCFKAGAEWMAEQFEKIEGKLVDWYEAYGVDYCSGISTKESFEVPEGFYIRKK